MRTFYAVVFDDVVQNTTPVYTDPEHNGLLGSADTVSFQVISNVYSGGPALTVAVEHSADEKAWKPRSATPELERVSLSWTDTNNHVVSYDSAGSVLCRVRFRVELSGSATVRVKIVACGRARSSRPRGRHQVEHEHSTDSALALLYGDAALLDGETMRHLQILEGHCDPNDRMLAYVKDELRRQARSRQRASTDGGCKHAQLKAVPDATPCGCHACPAEAR